MMLMSFVTVEILDKDETLCPNADNLVRFEVSGNTSIAGVDNGSPYSMERFKDNKRKAFYGKYLIVLQNDGTKGKSTLKATSKGLEAAEITLSENNKNRFRNNQILLSLHNPLPQGDSG